MGVTCQVLFNNRNGGHYKPGDSVEGTLKYVIDKPTVFTSVTLSLVGKGLCIIQSYIGFMHIGSEEYVDQYMSLIQATSEEPTLLEAGVYEQPFRFVLPEGIPSSYKDALCQIKYKILFKLVKPQVIGSVKKFKAEIKVHEYIQPVTHIVETEKKYVTFQSDKNNLKLKAVIEKAVVTTGDAIELKLFIKNDSKVPITAIRTELIRYVTYMSDYRVENETKVLKATSKEFPGAKEESDSTVLLSLPTLPDLYSVLQSKVLRREYKVKITAKVPFPYKSTSFEIPVKIRSKIDFREEMLQAQPPSYWQVMNEDQNKNELKKKQNINSNEERNEEYFTSQPHSSKQ